MLCDAPCHFSPRNGARSQSSAHIGRRPLNSLPLPGHSAQFLKHRVLPTHVWNNSCNSRRLLAQIGRSLLKPSLALRPCNVSFPKQPTFHAHMRRGAKTPSILPGTSGVSSEAVALPFILSAVSKYLFPSPIFDVWFLKVLPFRMQGRAYNVEKDTDDLTHARTRGRTAFTLTPTLCGFHVCKC